MAQESVSADKTARAAGTAEMTGATETARAARPVRARSLWANIQDAVFLVYICAATANQSGVGFDAFFVRATFVVYFMTLLPPLFVRVSLNRYIFWLLLFYGYIALSCLWGDPDFYGFYLNQFVQIVVLVFGVSQRLRTVDDVRRYVIIYYLAMLYYVALLYYRTPAWEWGTDEIGHEVGTNRNGVGLHSASGFIVSLYLVFGTKKVWTRVVNIVLMVIFAVVAVYSTSRKGFMMLPIGLGLYWLLSEKRSLLQVRNMARTVVGFLVVVLVLWYGTQYVMSSDLRIAQRMQDTYNIMVMGEASNDESFNERQYYIHKAQELFAMYPIYGAGSNGFAAYMKEIGYNHVAYCHNNFWEILSTLGLIGFIIFYYMHARCLYYGGPWRREMQNVRPLATALWVLLALNVVFGWWYVYYAGVGNNYLFLLVYMLCYTNHALPETRKHRRRHPRPQKA